MKPEYKQTYSQAVTQALNKMPGYGFISQLANDLLPTARQGADEFAKALQAFPDSIGAQPEPGTMFEPTPQQVYQEQGGYLELQQTRIQFPEQQQERSQEK